jgi:hypothetical protein
LAINRPGDRYEQEADRVAATVTNGGALQGLTFSSVPLLQRDGPPPTPSPRDPSADERRKVPGSSLPDLGFNEPKNDQHVQQPSEMPETNEDRLGKAGEKLAETFLEDTLLGKELTDKAEKFGEGFISTLPSLVVTLGIAISTVATMALRNEEFPLKGLVIKLPQIARGLKVKLAYKGPLSTPTEAGITFVYEPEAEKKPQVSDTDRTRAETERLAADQAKFQKGTKTPAERTAEQRQLDAIIRGRQAQSGNILGIQGLKPRRDDPILQREANDSSNISVAPPIVHDVLNSPGQPLDPATRSFMEPRFGHDFSGVRVHTDGRAATSAREVYANAYTVGHNIVFGAGRFVPRTYEGKRLIAHELTHVVQQSQNLTNSNLPITSAYDPSEIEAARASSVVDNSAKSTLPPVVMTPSQLSREPKSPPTPSEMSPPQSSPHTVEDLLGKVIVRLDTPTRNSLIGTPETSGTGFKTLVIAEFAHVDRSGKVVGIDYRYATNNNWSNPNLRDVTASFGLDQLDEMIVGKGHAEAITIESSGPRIVLTAMAISRKPCLGCVPEIVEYEARTGLKLSAYKRGSIWVVQYSPESSTSTGSGPTVKPGSAGIGKLKSVSPSLLKKTVIGIAITAMALGEPSEAKAAGKAETISVVAKQPTTGASVSEPKKSTPQPATIASAKPSIKPTVPVTTPFGRREDGKPATQDSLTTAVNAPKPITKSSTTSAAPTDTAKVKTPPLVKRPGQSPNKAAAKEYERGGGAAVLALQGFGKLLTSLGDAMQQKDAETAFYLKLDEITTMLDKNPGVGVIVEFIFYRAEPLPDSVILPGDRFDFISIHPARSLQDIQPGLYPLPKGKGTQLHIRRRWIKPTNQAPEHQVEKKAETRTPTLIQNAQQLYQALSLIRQHAGVSPTTVALAFKAATRTFASARIDVGGVLLDVTSSAYEEAFPKFEQEATASLTRRLDTLDGALRDLRTRYDGYSREGTWSRFLMQREFEIPPPTMLNGASESAKLAREWLGKKDFEMAKSHLQTGNEKARKVDFLLFHYSHGERHWLEDEP